MTRTHPIDRDKAAHTAGLVLLSVVTEPHRYDVTINRVMPVMWADRRAGYFWYWRVDFGGYPVASGFAWTEHGAERQAALCARQHAKPPARARHTPSRTYSINL